jgi:ferredoxin--NADP+ reductase
VHGPEFDGHQVDFDEYVLRKKMYWKEEKEAMNRHHPSCMERSSG